MITKPSVNIENDPDHPGIRAAFEVGYAVGVAEFVYEKHAGRRAVVTSCVDGVHHPGSLHYKGRAVDLRTRDLNALTTGAIVKDLKAWLTSQGFDVVLERDHIHIEFDPKPGREFLTTVP